MPKIEKIKNHFHENRTVYLACGVTAVVTGAGILFFSASKTGTEVVQKIVQVGFRNEANPTVIQMIERSTASKPVHLVGTNLYFNSLSEAAKETGHTLSKISRQINGHIPDCNGDVFELLELAS